jgi:hypothetical protein
MLLDLYLPRYDATQVVELKVDAPPAETYAAMREADLRDPVINALFAFRELSSRLVRRWRRLPPRSRRGPMTFARITTDEPCWTLLAENPGEELVVGSVGKFWQRDYGGRPVSAEQFVPFNTPGYAKLALGIGVRPAKSGGSILRYEARTATTDEVARQKFRRYWWLIRPGVAVVMRRALNRIRRAAEGQVPQLW